MKKHASAAVVLSILLAASAATAEAGGNRGAAAGDPAPRGAGRHEAQARPAPRHPRGCDAWAGAGDATWDLYGNAATPVIAVALPSHEPPAPAVVLRPETFEPQADEGTTAHTARQAAALSRLLARDVRR